MYNKRLTELQTVFKQLNDEMALLIKKRKELLKTAPNPDDVQIQHVTMELEALQSREALMVSEATQMIQAALKKTWFDWANEIPNVSLETEEALRIALEEVHVGLKVTGIQGDKEVQDLLKNRVASVIQEVMSDARLKNKENQIILRFGALGYKWYEQTQANIPPEESRKFSAAYATQRTIHDMLEEMPLSEKQAQQAQQLGEQLEAIKTLQSTQVKHSSEFYVLKSLQDDIAGIKGTFLNSRHCFNTHKGQEHIENRRQMLAKTAKQIDKLSDTNETKKTALDLVHSLHKTLNAFEKHLTPLTIAEVKMDIRIELVDMHSSIQNDSSGLSEMETNIANKLFEKVERLFQQIEKQESDDFAKAYALKKGMEEILGACDAAIASCPATPPEKQKSRWGTSLVFNVFSSTKNEKAVPSADDAALREEEQKPVNLKEIIVNLREHLERLPSLSALEKAKEKKGDSDDEKEGGSSLTHI